MYLQNILSFARDDQRIYLISAETQRNCAVPAINLKNSLARVIETKFPMGYVISESDFTALIG